MSDFIEIFILSFKEKENIENKKSLKSKLLDRFNYSLPKESMEFNITRKYDLLLKESEKCKKNKIQNYEEYFDKVWNEIEKKSKSDEINNISSADLSSENNGDENDKNANYNIPNSYNINKNINNNIKNIDNDTNLELREENACGGNICANICNIF